MKHKTSQAGFTLIELIAVMVILGILAAVIIPRITTLTSGAYESNVRSMYGVIKNEVNAQAVKKAMTGGATGHREEYPQITSTTANNYLKEWVEDFDGNLWAQHVFNGLMGAGSGQRPVDQTGASSKTRRASSALRPTQGIPSGFPTGASQAPSTCSHCPHLRYQMESRRSPESLVRWKARGVHPDAMPLPRPSGGVCTGPGHARPANPAPMIAVIASISELTWYANLPAPSKLRSMNKRIGVAGEMGYPT